MPQRRHLAVAVDGQVFRRSLHAVLQVHGAEVEGQAGQRQEQHRLVAGTAGEAAEQHQPLRIGRSRRVHHVPSPPWPLPRRMLGRQRPHGQPWQVKHPHTRRAPHRARSPLPEALDDRGAHHPARLPIGGGGPGPRAAPAGAGAGDRHGAAVPRAAAAPARAPPALEGTADALLGNLGLLFVPAGVGVVLYLPLLARDWAPISLAVVVGTLAAVALTGRLAQGLLRRLAMSELGEIWVYLAREPLAALTVTLLAWLGALRLQRAFGRHPLANPVLFAVAVAAAGLLAPARVPRLFRGRAIRPFPARPGDRRAGGAAPPAMERGAALGRGRGDVGRHRRAVRRRRRRDDRHGAARGAGGGRPRSRRARSPRRSPWASPSGSAGCRR